MEKQTEGDRYVNTRDSITKIFLSYVNGPGQT